MRRFLAAFLLSVFVCSVPVLASAEEEKEGFSFSKEKLLEALDDLRELGLSPMDIAERVIEGAKEDPSLSGTAEKAAELGSGVLQSAGEAAKEAGSSYLETAEEAVRKEAENWLDRLRESIMDVINEKLKEVFG